MTAGHPDDEATSPSSAAAGRPIGVFDSGIGGLSVIRHLQQQLPGEDLLYFADQFHIPYGARTQSQITEFSIEIARFLLGSGAKMIVVACNTATAAAIDTLRATFPDTPFVGMEPALKPAVAHTRSGKIGVLATPGTFASPRYAMLMDRYVHQIEVYEDPCVGLVEQIEAGDLFSEEVARILTRASGPMLSAGVDTLVLGCTHYPFVLPLLRLIVGDGVTIIDPAPAVARRTGYVLQQHDLSQPAGHVGALSVFTSGEPLRSAELTSRLLERDYPAAAVVWVDSALVANKTISY